MNVSISVGKRRCKPRNLYPYDREWAVTLVQGATVRVRNCEQDEAFARQYADALAALAEASGMEVIKPCVA